MSVCIVHKKYILTHTLIPYLLTYLLTYHSIAFHFTAAHRWLWTCGSQNCRGEVEVDTLRFPNLQVGTYVAHLIRRNSGGPYSSYAASPTFQVQNMC